jgi:hypothetical protein
MYLFVLRLRGLLVVKLTQILDVFHYLIWLKMSWNLGLLPSPGKIEEPVLFAPLDGAILYPMYLHLCQVGDVTSSQTIGCK